MNDHKRIFVTGASGCIGHYICNQLIHHTTHDLYLLVRNPAKLKLEFDRPGVTVLEGNMRDIEHFADLLKTINVAILTATAWGDPQETTDINITKTLRLMNLLDPVVCEQVLYFSTASILNHENQLLPEAWELGTDYIRSKYECYTKLPQLAIAPKITVLLPTLVFGGDETMPYSHLSSGLAEVVKWMPLIRFFGTEGSLHFIHAQDIATIVTYLVDNPPEEPRLQQMVLGNPRLSVNETIEQFCNYLNLRIYFRLPLTLWFANIIIKLFRLQMAAWDYFSLNYRHFYYKDPVSPALLGLPAYCPTLADVLRATGIPPGNDKGKHWRR
ncbi:MAG: NAD(P)-dependent oxidoreductase [Cyanobacteria bacterium]|nr:NAD(P)-dependent oxidoreductase [Cyanobacteriota bacterium]MDW8200913.1 NAD(P)-dependent oxidoreductase [Cyanobacteriota bacterium SKYGB_h_bin112]